MSEEKNPFAALEAEARDREASPAAQAERQDTLSQASALAHEVERLDREIRKTEEHLAGVKSRRWKILSDELPLLLKSVGVTSLSTDDSVFNSEMYYKASIPEEHREEAHKWLEDDGSGDIINRTVTVQFPKGFEEESKALQNYVKQHWQMAEVSEKMLVPWARLTSWLRERHQRIAQGEADLRLPPLDKFGATIARVVTIKPKKA